MANLTNMGRGILIPLLFDRRPDDPVNIPPKPLEPQEDEFRHPSYPIYHNRGEQLLYARMIVEGYKLNYPSIPILLIDRDKTVVDELHGEAHERVYKNPVYIPGHVQWSPPVYILHRYGIETEQEVLVTFPDLAFKLARIDLKSLIGGIMVMDLDKEEERTQFEILEVHKQPQDAWSLEGDVMNVAVTVDVRTPTSIEEEDNLPDYIESFGFKQTHLPEKF